MHVYVTCIALSNLFILLFVIKNDVDVCHGQVLLI